MQYFGRRSDQYEIVRSFETGQKPTVKESQAIADVIYSKFVGGEVQKVELIYTKFVSLISSDPIVQVRRNTASSPPLPSLSLSPSLPLSLSVALIDKGEGRGAMAFLEKEFRM